MAGFVPYFGYRQAKEAMAFLGSAFGFETITAYENDDGAIMHGEMRMGDAFLMVGTVEGDGPQPGADHGIYLTVEDVDAHFERAKAAGAVVVWAPHDTPFGTRRYRVKDIEGYEWSFGTYAPGQSQE